MNSIIVSRHPAAIQFIRETANLPDDVPVLAQASTKDVEGKIVYGNLPLDLAASAAEVHAVLFSGTPPRGAEYGLEEMRASGAHLQTFIIKRKEEKS